MAKAFPYSNTTYTKTIVSVEVNSKTCISPLKTWWWLTSHPRAFITSKTGASGFTVLNLKVILRSTHTNYYFTACNWTCLVIRLRPWISLCCSALPPHTIQYLSTRGVHTAFNWLHFIGVGYICTSCGILNHHDSPDSKQQQTAAKALNLTQWRNRLRWD